jgi:hypothetical protein
VERRFLLNVIIRKSATVLELLSSKDKMLLVGRNIFFILNLGFHVVDGVGRLNLERNGLSGQRVDEYARICVDASRELSSNFAIVNDGDAPLFKGNMRRWNLQRGGR